MINKNIFIKLKKIKKQYKYLEKIITNPNIINNQSKLCKFTKKYLKLTKIINYFSNLRKLNKEIKNTYNIITDIELSHLAIDELNILKKKKKEIENKINLYFLNNNKLKKTNCFLEIRAATGGNEATLFAVDLFKMYTKFAETQNWKIKIININYSEFGGYKEIIIYIDNKDAYNKLKFESGGHRVQRIPKTENQGRIHTSTCTVAVIPEDNFKKNISINYNDLRIDTFKSSGAGGQHVNTTDSAIRITYLPTGLIVECQDERSQHKNKAKALAILSEKLHNLKLKQIKEKESYKRRNLLGNGSRSDRIRTYNFPKSRITDHRTGLTIYNLEKIINGNFNKLINLILKKKNK